MGFWICLEEKPSRCTRGIANRCSLPPVLSRARSQSCERCEKGPTAVCLEVLFPQRATSFVSAEEVYFCFGNANGCLAKALVNSCSLPAAASLRPSALCSQKDRGIVSVLGQRWAVTWKAQTSLFSSWKEGAGLQAGCLSQRLREQQLLKLAESANRPECRYFGYICHRISSYYSEFSLWSCF